ncbi:protein lin-9 homolog [Bacillus rossius redtenbacheri]|uniref:protein lin-9 homolog n=1 Tax=Bacillus rossius redtenbacheri TaxID=93214 RepID=UPI002FDEF382
MDPDRAESPIFGPAALGLKRVGEETPPRPTPPHPGLVLNRRGMPARNRKRNRLYFDDDVVSTVARASPKRARMSPTKRGSAPKRAEAAWQTPEQADSPALSSPERRVGHQIGMRLRNLLKLPKAQRWVCYEWFYSNIDKPLFQGDNDFMTCLKESFPQLKTRRLTRVEWCQIRRLMGKPRRCSQAFFREERCELERKRAKIRQLQQRKATDLGSLRDLPGEIPLQLVIGTRVSARLRAPQDGLFNGSIDAVDTSNNTYRVTFERPGLGTHSVPDYQVLSHEMPETISLASFAQKFRPRAVIPFSPPWHAPDTPRLLHDPMLSSVSSAVKPQSTPAVLGPFSVKFLDTTVRLAKILNIKREKIKCLKEMNSEAEKKKSFGVPICEEFQRRYAGCIIELEWLNRDLQMYLSSCQNCCLEVAVEPSLVAMLTPTYLRDRSREEARDLVQKHNHAGLVRSSHVLCLITQLTSLLMQIKSLSESDRNAYEMKVLETSLDEIRACLRPENQCSFQSRVEVHIQHIQQGLDHCVGSHPFLNHRS